MRGPGFKTDTCACGVTSSRFSSAHRIQFAREGSGSGGRNPIRPDATYSNYSAREDARPFVVMRFEHRRNTDHGP